MKKLLNNLLDKIAFHFKHDASKMLIWTGVAGWGLSSLAQMAAVATNDKLSAEQKSFLLPHGLSVLPFCSLSRSFRADCSPY